MHYDTVTHVSTYAFTDKETVHSDSVPLTNIDWMFTNEQKEAFTWAFSLHPGPCDFVPFW